MNMIASATVIRGKGECEAYMNGVVMKEMKRLNERHASEMAVIKGQRNRLLSEQVKAMNPVRRASWGKLMKEWIATAWAQFFGLMLELRLIEEIKE